MILGLIPMISTAGFLLPQILSSNFIERSPRKKFFPFVLGFFFERVPLFLMVPSVWLFATNRPVAAVISFFVFFTWHNFGAGLLAVAWQDMIAKIIPVEQRGKFFGLSNFLSNVMAIAGASVVTLVMEKYAFPGGFIAVFTIAAACVLLSWIFLGLTREPPDPLTKPTISTREYFRRLPGVVRNYPNFRNFLIAQIVNRLGDMAGGFLMINALTRWTISESIGASFTIALMIGQSLGTLIFGYLADFKGHKLVLQLSVLFNIGAFAVSLLSASPQWFYLVFFLRGINIAASFVSSLALPLEFSKPEDRPTFIGLTGTLSGIAGAIAPAIGGLLATGFGYNHVFILSILLSMAAFLLLHWKVKEPRFHAQPPQE